jgi:hypothetical protein
MKRDMCLVTCSSSISKWVAALEKIFLVLLIKYRDLIFRVKPRSNLHWLYLAMALLKAMFWDLRRTLG